MICSPERPWNSPSYSSPHHVGLNLDPTPYAITPFSLGLGIPHLDWWGWFSTPFHATYFISWTSAISQDFSCSMWWCHWLCHRKEITSSSLTFQSKYILFLLNVWFESGKKWKVLDRKTEGVPLVLTLIHISPVTLGKSLTFVSLSVPVHKVKGWLG